MLSWKKSFGLSWNLWPEFFTKKSKVQHYKQFKTNHPQACTGNQDRQGRSHFSGDITIRTCPIKSDSHKFPEIGTYSSFKAALINIYIVIAIAINWMQYKLLVLTIPRTLHDPATPSGSVLWLAFLLFWFSLTAVTLFSLAWSSCFTHKKALVSAYYPTDYTTCLAFWYKRES